MTDEIRITRRVALDKDYEFYEFNLNIVAPKEEDVDSAIELFEKKVRKIRKLMGEPSLEIFPNIGEGEFIRGITKTFTPGSDLIDELHKAYLDPDIVEFIKPNIIKLKTFLKDKDKWTKYNNVFKDAGYKWVKDGKESRWER